MCEMIWNAFKVQVSEAFDLLHLNSFAELVAVIAGVAVGYTLLTAFVCLMWGAAQ